jgi:hypothetical protein
MRSRENTTVQQTISPNISERSKNLRPGGRRFLLLSEFKHAVQPNLEPVPLHYYRPMNPAASRSVLIAVLLLLLVNYPLLSAANKPVFIAGYPVLYLYLGAVWILALIFLAVASRGAQKHLDE